MWKSRPETATVLAWIAKTLELAAPQSPARARAIIARSYWQPAQSLPDAEEALAIATHLKDVDLLSLAFEARAAAPWAAGRFDEMRVWQDRRLQLLDKITDPDHRAEAHWQATFGYLEVGRMEDARRLAHRHDQIASPLTSHHRVHGVGLILLVEHLAGCWETILGLTPRAESAVAANLATPCVFNVRSLLVCAVANLHLGNEQEAHRLEEIADGLGMQGYRGIDLTRLKLALVRRDRERMTALVRSVEGQVDTMAGRRSAEDAVILDALAALGERNAVERETAQLVEPGTYLEPFALRALGLVRSDAALLEQAAGRFTAMGLEWHALQTREMLPSARRS